MDPGPYSVHNDSMYVVLATFLPFCLLVLVYKYKMCSVSMEFRSLLRTFSLDQSNNVKWGLHIDEHCDLYILTRS